jgi:biotin carboxyl carrier protein
MPLTGIDRHRIILTAAATAARGSVGPMHLRIKVEGVAYDVEVEVLSDSSTPLGEPEVDEELPEEVLQPPLPDDLRPEDLILRSPISGAIINVLAGPGQFLHRDEPVVVIEAMKMQTTIGAPVDGVVLEVGVAAGDMVKPGQLICKQAG